jgi:enoyl-CoA hydratase/carnithine racemase
MSDWELHKWNHDIVENWATVQKMKKPVIAAINGWAMGGGLELALSCDMRVASEKARMGLPEVSLGIVPGTGGTQRLPRLVGKGKALEMLLTGEPVDAKEAYRIGLVNKVVPEGEAVKGAEEIANKIIKNGPLAVMIAKDSVQVGEELPLDAAVEYSHKNVLLAAASEDAKEGYAAFLEKRKPVWKGKIVEE